MSRAPLSRSQPKSRHPLKDGRIILIATGVTLTLLAALLLIAAPLPVRHGDLLLYDFMLSARSAPPRPESPVLIGIDEESLKAYGQWPWPRYRLARLVEKLHGLGAKVVALDFLMPEPDRTSPDVIMSERQRDGEREISITGATGRDINSRQLAEAISGGDTVVGCFFEFGGAISPSAENAPKLPAGMVVVGGAGSDAAWPRPSGLLRSVPVLTAAAGAEGFTNAPHDLDGTLRRVPLLLKHDGSFCPSLAFSSLLLANPERTVRITGDASETSLFWGNHRVPLDSQGNLLLDFRRDEKFFPYFSARSILTGEQKPGSLQGKIVLVGPWAKGLGDVHRTPSGQSLSGLLAHATVIDTITAGTFINRPGWARGAELFVVLLLGMLCTWLISRPGFVLSLVTTVAGSVGSYLGGRELLVAGGLYLSPLLPMITPLLVMTVLSLLKYGTEARKLKQRTLDLVEAQDTIIIGMSVLAETRDRETGQHILRTRRYVEILARQLATNPRYSDLDANTIELITKSAPLHDIGKVGVPDAVLHKPESLTDQEYAIMKSHTTIGVEAMNKAISGTGHPEHHDFLQYARQMIESHHERWDGSGYPHGLNCEEIPLAGRLMAVADVYDAMVSKRVYKEGLSHEKAVEHIAGDSGKQFDPDVVAAFLARNEEFRSISRELSDKVDS